MFIFDVTEPITAALLAIAAALLIFLGKEIKKPHAPAIALVFFLILVSIHSIQLGIVSGSNLEQYRPILLGCISIDMVMILVTFFGYLWIDDIACKFYKKKSIDNSLNWFWKEV